MTNIQMYIRVTMNTIMRNKHDNGINYKMAYFCSKNMQEETMNNYAVIESQWKIGDDFIYPNLFMWIAKQMVEKYKNQEIK